MTAECGGKGGWCGRGDKPRTFTPGTPLISTAQGVKVDQDLYGRLRLSALTGTESANLTIPKRSAKAWTMSKGDLCRVTLIEGPQVGVINLWNIHDPFEHLSAAKTSQLHSCHLKIYDRLWSTVPYLKPMATIVGDSLKYPVDSDGAGLHDIISTRCDEQSYEIVRGTKPESSCHSQLTSAIKIFGLQEKHVHDGWNIFARSGFTKDTHEYFVKSTPATKGDYIEFIAEMDILVALSTCPLGDIIAPMGKETSGSHCYPMGVEVFKALLP